MKNIFILFIFCIVLSSIQGFGVLYARRQMFVSFAKLKTDRQFSSLHSLSPKDNQDLSERSAINSSRGPFYLKFKVIGKLLAPIVGFYGVMLAPLYGIGLPLWFGSMTDFSKLKNRGLPSMQANEYIVAPKGFTSGIKQ